jgi:leader peptidase (prepilin peptidase)/N-methyltransferase
MIPPEYLHPYLTCMVFVFGACVGSFLNVCIYRIPLDQSVVRPRSHCYSCDRAIPWYDNIPLISYLILRGRCRQCQTAYSARYFLVELLTALLFLGVWWKLGGDRDAIRFDPLIPVYWMVLSGLILGTFVDFDHLILPNRLTIGGMIAGVICSLLVPSLHGVDSRLHAVLWSLAGLAAGFCTLWLVARAGRMAFKQDAMGFGDVKLLGAIGAFLGIRAVFFTVLVSSLVGSVAGIAIVLTKGRAWQSRIPYGPYLALAAVIWIFQGRSWWDWYVHLLAGGAPAP